MLTYLINVTDDLLAVFLIIGVIRAFVYQLCGEKGLMIYRGGLVAGVIIAAIRTYITNTRRLVGGWKVGAFGYQISLLLLVLLLLALLVFLCLGSFKSTSAVTLKVTIAKIVVSLLTALLVASYLYSALPNVLIYPFKFDTGGNGMLSTDFLFRLGGYLLGLLICFVAAVCAYRISVLAAKKGYTKLLVAAFLALNLMYGVYNFAKLMLVLTPRKIVDSIALFHFAAASNNNAKLYTYIAFLVLVVFSVILWIHSYTDKEPYTTNAQHRKQRAVWRSAKRYSVVLLCCFVLGILCTTWFVKLNTVVIREAPTEDPVIVKNDQGEDSELCVPIDMVMDGHLHRFGYKTPGGKTVRFIVVLKQEDTTNYGVGLDACEICGEAGYYENNDGQVVCKKCNVVMNKTTIGMKGGCNPIIIDYDIDESNITVPVSEMVNNEDRFKE